MQNKEELIQALIDSAANNDNEDALVLPNWDESSWGLLFAGAEVMELDNSDVLVHQNETSNDLYFLAEGKLEVSVPQMGSMTMTPVVSIGVGSIVGEISFLDNGARSASVWSKGKSKLLRLPEAAFNDFRIAHPQLACDLLFAIGKIIAKRLRRCLGSSKGTASGGDYF